MLKPLARRVRVLHGIAQPVEEVDGLGAALLVEYQHLGPARAPARALAHEPPGGHLEAVHRMRPVDVPDDAVLVLDLAPAAPDDLFQAVDKLLR